MRLRISSRLICASCVQYFDRMCYHRYFVPSCRHFDCTLSLKSISRCVLTIGRVQANCLLNTRTLPCRTYTMPTRSFGVRMNNPSVSFSADYRTYTLDNSLFLDYDYWSVNKLGCCISIPIARCNGRVELSIDSYFFHQVAQRFLQYMANVLINRTGLWNFLSIPVYLTNMLKK